MSNAVVRSENHEGDHMRIEHIAIWTHDLERLKTFYETYFSGRAGTKYVNPQKNFESYFLEFEGGARLELMRKPEIPLTTNDRYQQFTGIVHFAISVGSKEKVDQLAEKIKQDGFELLDGPRTTGDGYYECVILDPDGNRIEITA
jgi:lactoylglutathione lyase